MEELKLANHNTTLVDSVEESLISYFKEQGLRPGCSIPNEMELAASLGVGRAVLREALSRFKMTGMIVSRTKKGMVLGEPSLLGGMKRCINPLLMNESTLCDILEFRVALEIGISDNIFRNLTDADVAELKEIVEMSQVIGNNKYAPVSEHRFHTKLYEITGNKIITEFQDIIYPVLDFVKEKYRDFLEPIEKELERAGALVTHRDLLKYIENRDLKGYKKGDRRAFQALFDLSGTPQEIAPEIMRPEGRGLRRLRPCNAVTRRHPLRHLSS
jgi:GntR family transcriptional repressor for pyruvate dehydrogenase complex